MTDTAAPEPGTIVHVWEAVCANCKGMLQRNSEDGPWWHQLSGLTSCPVLHPH